jgi:hypothetical protein
MTATAPPITAKTPTGTGGIGQVDAAQGHCANASNHQTMTEIAAPAKSHQGDHNTPSMAKGVTTKVTHGMVNKLAAKDTHDTCPNQTTVMGTKAKVIRPCSRSNCHHHRTTRCHHEAVSKPETERCVLPMRMATATKLNQNPACNKDQGSQHTTAHMAHAHTTGHGQRRAPQRKATPTASIKTVRCAGTPQPAKTA